MHILTIILQIEPLIDVAKDISPWNAAAYGALVMLLAIVIYVVNKERLFWRNKYTDEVKDTMTLMNNVNEKMPSLADTQEMRREFELLKAQILNNK